MSPEWPERFNSAAEGWLQAMGVTITHATDEEVRAELTVGPEHLQSYGIVHGGVHCGLIESLASIGAALFALPRGQSVVGLENSTSFVRAVRAGAKLHAVSTPITRGRLGLFRQYPRWSFRPDYSGRHLCPLQDATQRR